MCIVKKDAVLKRLDEIADGDIAKGHLTDKQYAEIIALAVRVNESTSDFSRFESGKMVIALYEKLDKKNATQPRDEARKLEEYATASYDKTISKGLAIWKMGLATTPTNDEEIAKTAELDSAYRANLANKAEQARKRNEFVQSM